MIHVITEDSNSARIFWNAAFMNFLTPSDFKMCELLPNIQSGKTAGNTTLKRQALAALDKSNPGDYLFIAFDNVDSTDMFCVADFLNGLRIVCDERDVKLIYTKYYCFEELYLGYDGLLNLCHNSTQDAILLDTLTHVYSCIREDRNYYDVTENRIQYVFSFSKNAKINREHFANALLTKITRELKGYFTICKREKSFGACWYMDCKNLQQNKNDKHILYFCDSCKYDCKNSEAHNKLLDVIRSQGDFEILKLLHIEDEINQRNSNLQQIKGF